MLLENLVNYAKSLDLDYPLGKVGVSPFNLVSRFVASKVVRATCEKANESL